MGREHGYISIDDAGNVTVYRQVDPVSPVALAGVSPGADLPDWWDIDSTPGSESVEFQGAVTIRPSDDSALIGLLHIEGPENPAANVIHAATFDGGGFFVGPTGGVTISPSASALPLNVLGAAGSFANLLDVYENSGVYGVSVGYSGNLSVSQDPTQSGKPFAIEGPAAQPKIYFRSGTLPADGAFSNNYVGIWYDSTNGAAKVMFKGKSANGTVVTGGSPTHMNTNDRFALELGRALVRALVAEAQLEQAQAALEQTKEKLEDTEDSDVIPGSVNERKSEKVLL